MNAPSIDPWALEIPFRTIGAALNGFAGRDPGKTAIHSIDQFISLTFAEFRDHVKISAGKMAALGVGRGDRVAILSDECVEKLILMLAAWRCGASACPFHTEITIDHLREILIAINPSLIISRVDLELEELTRNSKFVVAPFSSLNDTQGFFGPNGPIGPLPEEGAEYEPYDEACIFATSGTTDRPKCVVWDHLGLWLCGLSTIKFTDMRSEDRLLEYRTFSWLSPQIVTVMPFVSLGLTVVMAAQFSRSRFFDWVRDFNISVAAGVPTVINMLLDDPIDVPPDDIKSLRVMTASSAPLAPERWRQFEAHYGIPLLQFYGASEGGWLCGNRHDRRRIGTAGPPAHHMDLTIVDTKGEPCPTGIEGEITIRGHQTAVATISSDGIWEDRSSFRLTDRVRVGDLGVMDADGFITVTGRVKDVILRGGVSIAPLEIDSAIMKLPSIREAAAIGVPDEIWGEEIACYVVPSDGNLPSVQEVLHHAAETLPHFKRPKFIRFVDTLPKNERGKVRRDDLKAWWVEMP